MIHIYLFDPDPAEQIEVGQIVVLAATLILRPLVAASFHRRQFLQRPHLARRRCHYPKELRGLAVQAGSFRAERHVRDLELQRSVRRDLMKSRDQCWVSRRS